MTQLEVFQIGLLLAVAALAGAATGYAASLRGRFQAWAVVVAPVAACVVNIGVLYLVAWAESSRSGVAPNWTWGQLVGGTFILAMGVGIWGLIPAVLASLAFQIHCRYSRHS